MKWTARKIFKVEMAHQLTSSYTKACQTLHGHSYIIEVFLESAHLDADNMVIDFKYVKECLSQVIEPLDHSVMLHDVMPEHYLTTIRAHNTNVHLVPFNPTAEAMAADLLVKCQRLMADTFPDYDIVVSSVRVHETATGFAECSF